MTRIMAMMRTPQNALGCFSRSSRTRIFFDTRAKKSNTMRKYKIYEKITKATIAIALIYSTFIRYLIEMSKINIINDTIDNTRNSGSWKRILNAFHLPAKYSLIADIIN